MSLYNTSSPNIIWTIKSRTLRWTGQAARMEDDRRASKITGKPIKEEKNSRKA